MRVKIKTNKYECPKCRKVYEIEHMGNKAYCKMCYREYMRNYMKKRREQNKCWLTLKRLKI